MLLWGFEMGRVYMYMRWMFIKQPWKLNVVELMGNCALCVFSSVSHNLCDLSCIIAEE